MADHTSANDVVVPTDVSNDTDPNHGIHLTLLYEARQPFSINIVDANENIITTLSAVDPRKTIADIKKMIANLGIGQLNWRKRIDSRMTTGGSGRRFIYTQLVDNLTLIQHKMFESFNLEVFESREITSKE